jgi:hypothetical protein
VAQLAVRLTEVTPDGQSWLVSYGLLNLTRRDSFAAPQPLDPGEDYDIVVELFPIAHRFKRAHRLRIALSDGLWPLAWPSPEPADLAFTLGPHSRLELPKRMPEAVPASSELKDIVTPPEPGVKRPTTTLLPVEPGQYRIENNSPSHTNTIEATNTAMARQTWETSTLREGQPGTCSWSERVVSSWKRDDWSGPVFAWLNPSSRNTANTSLQTAVTRR